MPVTPSASSPTPAVHVRAVAHDSADAIAMQEQLSALLLARYGSDGKASFAEFPEQGSVFAVAYGADGTPVGCGALRPLSEADGAGEIKRMLATLAGQGIGSSVLHFLEQQARALGYRELRLSTRVANTGAVAFYRAHGFSECAPYGRYAGRTESICLAKPLV